jgi:hypothetical protein
VLIITSHDERASAFSAISAVRPTGQRRGPLVRPARRKRGFRPNRRLITGVAAGAEPPLSLPRESRPGCIPFWVAWVPARRDLPVLDHFTGKLALAHATLAGFCHLFGDAPAGRRAARRFALAAVTR